MAIFRDGIGELRRHVKDESVDLVYLDPPFNSNANYNVLFGHADGSQAAAQIKAFDDTWRWDQAAAASFQETVTAGGTVASSLAAFQTEHDARLPGNDGPRDSWSYG